MSNIVEEHERAGEAFRRPTLALLSQRWAVVVVAVLRVSFPNQSDSVGADDFHAMVTGQLARLRDVGADAPVEQDARILVRQWVDSKWLIRDVADDGERYSLTSHAQEALDFVRRLSGQRAMLSESRIRNLLTAAHAAAMDANPDREARLRDVDAQIAELTAERELLASGAEIAVVSPQRLSEQFREIREMLASLPADFLRVAEAGKQVQQRMTQRFMADEQRAADVIDAYLDETADMVLQTVEGQAFAGALALLRDQATLEELSQDLETLLSHEFAESLPAADRRDVRNAVMMISSNTAVALEQQQRSSSALRNHLTGRDRVNDKELDAALRRAEAAVANWWATGRLRDTLPQSMVLHGAQVGNLATRFTSEADLRPPPPLSTTTVDVNASGVDVEQLRALGGPRVGELIDHLQALVASDSDRRDWTIREAFEAADPQLSRPVELIGYRELAVEGGGVSDIDEVEVVTTQRSDGSARQFVVPVHRFDREVVEMIVDRAQQREVSR